MARLRDESKRKAILETSKMLFAQKGFYGTSVADIVRETGFSVGTLYTYFHSKEEIVRSIVEEGWSELYGRLEAAMAAPGTVEGKLKLLLDKFIPELLRDLDLINILLSEAIDYTRIEEKIEKLTDLLYSLLKPLLAASPQLEISRKGMETALSVFFLGMLSTVKVARSASIGLKVADVIDFVQMVIENSLGVRLK